MASRTIGCPYTSCEASILYEISELYTYARSLNTSCPACGKPVKIALHDEQGKPEVRATAA
jgi:ribosomal protein S27AE